jgi:hypothetical protein
MQKRQIPDISETAFAVVQQATAQTITSKRLTPKPAIGSARVGALKGGGSLKPKK